MRVKTEARRKKIILEAWKIFREQGYQHTTMTMIATKLGGSKGTLYGYFSSKEELLLAAVDDIVAERGEAAFDQLLKEDKLQNRLCHFAYAYLSLRADRDTIALDRILISEALHSNFGQVTQDRLLLPQWRRFAEFLLKEAELDIHDIDAALQAAEHFRALITYPIVETCLFRNQSLKSKEIEKLANNSVSFFLNTYKSSL